MFEQNALLRNRYRILSQRAQEGSVVAYDAYDSEAAKLVQLWAWPGANDARVLGNALRPFFTEGGLIGAQLLDVFNANGADVAVVDTRGDSDAIRRFPQFLASLGVGGAASPPSTPQRPTMGDDASLGGTRSDRVEKQRDEPSFDLSRDLPDVTVGGTRSARVEKQSDEPLFDFSRSQPDPTVSGGRSARVEKESQIPTWEPPPQGAQGQVPPTAAKAPRRRMSLPMMLGAGVLLLCCLTLVCCQQLASGGGPLAGVLEESGVFPTMTALAGGGEAPPVATTESGTSAGQGTPIIDMQPGTCFNDLSGTLTEGEALSCDLSHQYEVFSVFDVSNNGVYPGKDALDNYALEQCTLDFESYVGLAYDQSELFFSTLAPNAASWDAGSRAISCILEGDTGVMLQGSMRGANR
ncbi:MAG: septum formation family protein [Anaerolineales bacterium]|nr:septum formation family protein [Anaerolineales bacterium]